MRECAECDGSGQVECGTCDSDNEVQCDECYGEERTSCGTCEGARYLPCPDCSGNGEVDCSDCYGTGRIDDDDDDDDWRCDCSSCRASRRELTRVTVTAEDITPARKRGLAPLEYLKRGERGVLIRDTDAAPLKPDNGYERDTALWCRAGSPSGSGYSGYTCLARRGHRGNHEAYYMGGKMSACEWTPADVLVRGDHRCP